MTQLSMFYLFICSIYYFIKARELNKKKNNQWMQLCWMWSSSQFGSESDWISNNMWKKKASSYSRNGSNFFDGYYCRFLVFGDNANLDLLIAASWIYIITYYLLIFLQLNNPPREKRVITTTIPAACQLISDRILI